jgi:AcrR family transcriptional regulator
MRRASRPVRATLSGINVVNRTRATKIKGSTAESILEAAERLCAAHGIEAVSIRHIAAEAGVSIPVIYHHYGSRTKLLRAIVDTRFGEIAGEYRKLVSELEAQTAPTVSDIVRAVLQPINHWRRPGREASLQFYALALVCPLPEVKNALDAGVLGFRPIVMLLQRVLPHLTAEEICWRLHFTIKISQETQWDAARLDILSDGACNSDDPDEALARGIAFAVAAFNAPPHTRTSKAVQRRAMKRRRRARTGGAQ